MNDEQAINDVIVSWVQAIQTGDLDGVVANHTSDIVMFDVPPPDNGVRGLDAYRVVWPPFFEWLRQGSAFEPVSVEIVAGGDIAYAMMLLRCGEPAELEANPERRLRITLGLRKQAGRWLIAHEHHSFPAE